MASNTVDSIFISLGFNTAELRRSAGEAENIIQDMTRNMRNALITVFSANYLKDLVTGFAQTGSSLAFLSQKTGESVKTLNAWQQAAKRMGGTAEGFTATLNSVRDAIQDVAVTGGSGIGGLLASIGVKARDSQGHIRSTTEVFKDMANIFSHMDKNRAQYIARQLGIDDATLRLMLMGKQRLGDYLKTMEKQSTITDASAQRAVILKRRIDDLTLAYDDLKITAGIALIPIFNHLANIFSKLANDYIPAITKSISAFQDKIGLTNDQVAKIIIAFGGLIALNSGLKLIAFSFGAIGTAINLILSPISLLVMGLTSAIMLYEHFKNTQPNSNGDAYLNPNIKPAWEQLKKGNFKQAYQTLTKDQIIPPDLKGKNLEIFNSLNAHEKSQFIQEGGFRNPIGDVGTKGGPSYGLFQIKTGTAAEVLGRTPSKEELLNPDFNLQVYRALQAKYMKESNGNQLAADARYNGGTGGLKHFLKSGQSYNNYAEDIAARTRYLGANSSQLAAAQNTSNSTTSNVNVGTVNVHGQKNPEQLIKEFQQYADPMNLTRTMNNFQSGRGS